MGLDLEAVFFPLCGRADKSVLQRAHEFRVFLFWFFFLAREGDMAGTWRPSFYTHEQVLWRTLGSAGEKNVGIQSETTVS